MGEIVLGVFGLYLIFQVVMGYRRGLMKSMLNLASWILTFAIAYEGASYFKDRDRSDRIYDCLPYTDDHM